MKAPGVVTETAHTSPRHVHSFLLPLVLLGVLQAADVLTTLVVLSQGGAELNPVAAWFIERNMLPAAKIGCWVVLVAWVIVNPQIHTRRLAYAIWSAVGIYTIVVATNTAQLIV